MHPRPSAPVGAALREALRRSPEAAPARLVPLRLSRTGKALFATAALLFILACSAGSSALPTQTAFVITATSPASTATTAAASPTEPPTVIAPTATHAPTCSVLQELNLRIGPGTAYNPPIIALQAGTEFVPMGFNPVGVPGGPWVQARVDSINKTGWVSAGSQFVSCNLDLASLPEVSVAPPPKPAAPRVGTGAVDGNNIDSFRFSLNYNNDYFIRMYVFRSDDPDEQFTASKDGRGISSVLFIVTSPNGNRTFLNRTERNAGYCIFGGGEPECNPWLLENGQYMWTSGGEPVIERDYELTIEVTADDGEVGDWIIPINVRLP